MLIADYYHVSTVVTLGMVAATLLTSIAASVCFRRTEAKAKECDGW